MQTEKRRATKESPQEGRDGWQTEDLEVTRGDSTARNSGHQRAWGPFLDLAESGGHLSLHFAAFDGPVSLLR